MIIIHDEWRIMVNICCINSPLFPESSTNRLPYRSDSSMCRKDQFTKRTETGVILASHMCSYKHLGEDTRTTYMMPSRAPVTNRLVRFHLHCSALFWMFAPSGHNTSEKRPICSSQTNLLNGARDTSHSGEIVVCLVCDSVTVARYTGVTECQTPLWFREWSSKGITGLN